MECAVYAEGGRITAVEVLPPPVASLLAAPTTAALVGTHAGTVSLWQVAGAGGAPESAAAADAADDGDEDVARRGAARRDAALYADKVASVAVSRHAVQCLDVAAMDSGLAAVAGAADASISLLRLADDDGGAPTIAQRVGVPPANAPTALCMNAVNKLLMSADARGGVALYSLSALDSAAPYSATLEGGSGPHVFDACFWSNAPSSILLAAGSSVYLVDSRVAPDSAGRASSVTFPTATGAWALSVDSFKEDPWLVATGCEDGSLTIVDLRRPGAPWASLAGAHAGPVWGVRAVPHTPFMVSAGDDGVLALAQVSRFTSPAAGDPTSSAAAVAAAVASDGAAVGAGSSAAGGAAGGASLAHRATLLSTPLPLNACAISAAGVAFAGDDAGVLHVVNCGAVVAAAGVGAER